MFIKTSAVLSNPPGARWAACVAVGLAAAVLVPRTALAGNPQCTSLPNPVIGEGGSATVPVLKAVGTALANAIPPQTVIYKAPGACVGVNDLFSGTKVTGTATYWNADGVAQLCDLPATGIVPQFANTSSEATSCEGVASLPATIGDFQGAINAFDFIVPKVSTETSISREAAHFVFGWGDQSGVAPWNVAAELYVRNATSAVQLIIGEAIGVPANKFKGLNTKDNATTLSSTAGSRNPNSAIGIVSGEVADAGRRQDIVRILAYQHTGQSCGYLPDSTAQSFDKRNVRTGQYVLWAATHFYAAVDNTGAIVDPAARQLVGYFAGTVTPPTGVDILALEIKNSTVPRCAMEVSREHDLGPLQSYAPAEPCGCYFDKVATGQTTCQACSDTVACPSAAPHCRHGYCEVN